jgi:hypothetical protein
MKKLSLVKPEPTPDKWDELSERILKLLHREFEIKNDEELCGCSLNDFMQKQELKDLSVMALGNDFKTSVDFIRGLVLKGDGMCPECGSDCIEVIEAWEFDPTSDFGAFAAMESYVCDQCGNTWDQ